AMSQDPTLFKDPENFISDCFLAKGMTQGHDQNSDSLVSLTWGFSCRSCTLAVYSIGKKVMPDGNEVNIQANFITYEIFLHPASFPCSITPQSHEAQVLINGLS
ncbi:hypothetical protein Moror_7759, partial [Moniliophthora roreri MCA 2997]